jgi:hypothetical protein
VLVAACRNDEKVHPDSARADSFRVVADSIALDMARAIASQTSRSGQWTDAADSSEWTARMQGEHVSIIEERVRLRDSGTAVRGFFFGKSGALEQVSEQRRQPVKRADGRMVMQLVETQIEFVEAGARARRTIDNKTADVSADEIEQFRRHAAELVQAARRAPASPPAP